MQFKVITTILLFFVVQTVAAPGLQARDSDPADTKTCTLVFISWFYVKGLTNDLLRLPQAIPPM